MPNSQVDVPIAFLIFHRPDTTERVFAEIAKARSPKPLVVADGPRSYRAGEAEQCRRTRALIERVDWLCEVETKFSEASLGCRKRHGVADEFTARRMFRYTRSQRARKLDRRVPGDRVVRRMQKFR